MSDRVSPREPRSRLIGRFVEHWLNGVVEKQQGYADKVRELYWQMLPDPEDRQIRFHWTGDAYHDLRENRQVVMRRLRGAIKFEADFEEAVIEALPDDVRGELLRQLSERYGLLAVPLPRVEGAGAFDLALLAKEFGEAVESYGYLMEGDGVIDANDDPQLLARALAETDDLLAAATLFRETLTLALGEGK